MQIMENVNAKYAEKEQEISLNRDKKVLNKCIYVI